MIGFDTFGYFADLLTLLPLLLPLYHGIRHGLTRRLMLAAAGLLLLTWIAPRLALFHLLFWTVAWLAQMGLGRLPTGNWRLAGTWGAVGLALAPMIAWKANPTGFGIQFNLRLADILWSAGRTLGGIDAAHDIVVPLGLSFAAFRAVDMVVQRSLDLIPPLSLDRVLFFGLFPTVQTVGPVAEWSELALAGERRPFQFECFRDGVFRCGIGLIKIFILAWPLQFSADIFTSPGQYSALLLWSNLFIFVWYFYINFAGYSDLAIGISMLFGARLKENFANPYLAPNPQLFWSRWHMSLTRFAQRNVFMPLGGFRPRRQYVAIAATMTVIAFWHDVSWPTAVFALYHCLALVVHRIWSERQRRRGHKPNTAPWAVMGKILATHAFVTLSFPLLISPARQVPEFYLRLFGLPL